MAFKLKGWSPFAKKEDITIKSKPQESVKIKKNLLQLQKNRPKVNVRPLSFRIHGSPSTTKGISMPKDMFTGISGSTGISKGKSYLGVSVDKDLQSKGSNINISGSIPVSKRTSISGGINLSKQPGSKTSKSYSLGIKTVIPRRKKKKIKKYL